VYSVYLGYQTPSIFCVISVFSIIQSEYPKRSHRSSPSVKDNYAQTSDR